MKITVIKEFDVVLEEVYVPVKLKTRTDEEMLICMRDGGFEFKYNNEWYEAKNGKVEKL